MKSITPKALPRRNAMPVVNQVPNFQRNRCAGTSSPTKLRHTKGELPPKNTDQPQRNAALMERSGEPKAS